MVCVDIVRMKWRDVVEVVTWCRVSVTHLSWNRPKREKNINYWTQMKMNRSRSILNQNFNGSLKILIFSLNSPNWLLLRPCCNKRLCCNPELMLLLWEPLLALWLFDPPMPTPLGMSSSESLPDESRCFSPALRKSKYRKRISNDIEQEFRNVCLNFNATKL